MHGTVTRWNDDRGFGFVVLPQSREEIFVHISAFQRGSARPRIGETISFDVRVGPDGRKRAEHVMRPGTPAPAREHRNAARGRSHSSLGIAFTIAAIGTLGVVGYQTLTSGLNHTGRVRGALPESARSEERFKCDGRTKCSQMTSCDEAVYFLNHCPNTQMDGNHDGEPCEQQWCK